MRKPALILSIRGNPYSWPTYRSHETRQAPMVINRRVKRAKTRITLKTKRTPAE